MKYNKLVRDKIPEYICSKGEAVVYHVADENEYWRKLKEKLTEEVDEFRKNEDIDELTDVMEVLDAIVEYKGFDRQEIERNKEAKAEARGKFKARIILDES